MSAQSLSLCFCKGIEDRVSYFSFLSQALPLHASSLFGYITVVDFIHFSDEKKETSACSGILFLTMIVFVFSQSGNRGEMERTREEEGKEGSEEGGGSPPR